ncbi:unnamed protein product [Camellia sinensis]
MGLAGCEIREFSKLWVECCETINIVLRCLMVMEEIEDKETRLQTAPIFYMLLVLSCSAGMAARLFVEQLCYCTALSPSVPAAAFYAVEIRDFGCYNWMLQLLLQPIWMPLFGLLQNLDGGATFPSEKIVQDCSCSDISSLKINTGSGKTEKTKGCAKEVNGLRNVGEVAPVGFIQMAWMEKDVGNGKERDPVGDNGSLKEEQLASGKDALSYANILCSRNKFIDSLALYESILEKDCGNVDAHIGKGICLHMQNMGRLAYESFAEAIKLEPQNVCALTHCGIVYKDEGQLIEAAESYQKALRADPSYKPVAEYLAIVLTDLGTSLKLAGNAQEGIQKYYEAPAYYNLGVVYSEMMQYDMALGCYEKAALERPLYAEAYCNMGVIHKNRGDLESALACYERCLAVSPNFEIAKNMGNCIDRFRNKDVKLEGDIDQGVEYYKKALYYNWHYADAMYNLGVAYGEMLKFDMAIVFYELAFHFNPHCAEACNNLGVIYKDRDNLDKAGKMDAAASMIEKAIVANPTYAEAYNNLVIINPQNLHCRTKDARIPYKDSPELLGLLLKFSSSIPSLFDQWKNFAATAMLL